MKRRTNIRGLEFGLVLSDPDVIQFLRDRNPIEIADLGAGTNDEIVVSVLDLAPRDLAKKKVIIYLIDNNPSWLSILSQRLPKNVPGVVLVQADLEQMTRKAQIMEPFAQSHQWVQMQISTIRTLLQHHRIPQASMDLVVFNRDMLGWLQFFNADTDLVLKETQKILKSEGALIVTQPGLKYRYSHELLGEYGFRFIKRCIFQLETGKRSESTQPVSTFEGPKSNEYIYLVYQNQSS